jgi:hypothetical protein
MKAALIPEALQLALYGLLKIPSGELITNGS